MSSLGQSHSVCQCFSVVWILVHLFREDFFLQLQHYFHGFLSFFSFSSYFRHNRNLDRKRVTTKSIIATKTKNGSLASGWILILKALASLLSVLRFKNYLMV